MTDPLSPDAIRAGIADVLAPLKAQLAQVDEQIEAKDAELKALRDVRTDLRSIIGRIDPETPMRGRSANGGKPKTTPKGTAPGRRHFVSEDRVNAVLDWIREHGGSEAVYAQQIGKALNIHPSAAGDALHVLADRGLARLDSVGGQRGTTKFYKLTEDRRG